MEVRFYHLQSQNLEQGLPALLSKAYKNGHRIHVRAGREETVRRLNEHLWTYHPDSFLPHGAKEDGNADRQPIWLDTGDDNPNGADVLVLLEGQDSGALKDYTLVCSVFDGNDQEAVEDARARWKRYKEEGFEVTYWQQDETGRWNKKA